MTSYLHEILRALMSSVRKSSYIHPTERMRLLHLELPSCHIVQQFACTEAKQNDFLTQIVSSKTRTSKTTWTCIFLKGKGREAGTVEFRTVTVSCALGKVSLLYWFYFWSLHWSYFKAFYCELVFIVDIAQLSTLI